jgi:hypothetical protein
MAAGKSTRMLIAALRFRFNECEGNDYSFKRLGRDSTKKRPHKALTVEELQLLE